MIRQATLDDLDQIWQLRLNTKKLLNERGIDQWQFDDPNKKRFIKDIQNETFFVYEKNQQVISMMYLQLEEEKTYQSIDGSWAKNMLYVTIHRFAVDKSYLGQGIAKDMLAFAKSFTLNQNRSYIRIDTHENNRQAINLFLSQGFQFRGKIMLNIEQGDRMRLAYDLCIGEKT